MFHKEGFTIISISLIALCLLNAVAFITLSETWAMSIAIISLVLFLLILQFFRNPKRDTPVSDSEVIAPVDGKVVVIEEVFEKEFFKDQRIQVSIFMSPINVHVTRHPISGTVAYSKYHPGKYLVAWHPKASEENERTTVVVKNNRIQLLYRQIAGALAKRIVNYAEEGKQVLQGSDCGFIKFGSRVDVFLPLDTKINVTLDQKVKGGIDSIASLIES